MSLCLLRTYCMPGPPPRGVGTGGGGTEGIGQGCLGHSGVWGGSGLPGGLGAAWGTQGCLGGGLRAAWGSQGCLGLSSGLTQQHL